MKISKSGLRDLHDPVWHAIIHATTHLSEEDRAEHTKRYQECDEHVDVVFQVNGLDLPFDTVIQRFSDCYKRAVNEAAAELVRDRYHEIFNGFHDFIDATTDALEAELEKRLGVKVRERDEY